MNEPSRLPERRLTMFDCTSIVVGIIIGSGIYESTSRVAGALTTPTELLFAWVAGGLFSLVGAWCYAELATRFPEQGGDYVYLSYAFGRPIGFLFAWIQLWIIRPGSIGAMACIFAAYAIPLREAMLPNVDFGRFEFLFYSCGSIVVLSLVNMAGVPLGKRTQNVLSAAKVLGLLAVVVAGLTASVSQQAAAVAPPLTPMVADWGFAMIFVLFAYSGWNEMGCVTAEVRNPERNISRALLLATGIVTLVYLGINGACVEVLGLSGMAGSDAVMTDTVSRTVGPRSAVLLSGLICISALGSTNGMIFTGARIYYAFGSQHPMFRGLAAWSPRFGTPLQALALQGAVTALLVIGFSGGGGSRYDFDRLVMFMTPPFYAFLALSAAAVIAFRVRRHGEANAFRSPLFPLAPLAMAAGSLFLLWKGIEYIQFQMSHPEAGARAWWPAIWVIATAASGLFLAVIDARQRLAAKNQNEAAGGR
jgi:amino acid transporter